MLSRLRIRLGATVLAVLATSGGVVAAQADDSYPPTQSFTDVAPDHTFSAHIEWLAERDISTGYDNGNTTKRFEPSAAVLREQMAAFLYRLAGEPAFTPPATSPFVDVPTTHVFYKHISWLASGGISTGYELGGGRREFRPGQPVLREQMAAFLYRYEGGTPNLEYPANVSLYFFGDTLGHAFRQQIRWLGNWSISTGYGTGLDNVYRPSDPVLREQMAAFMFRLEYTLPSTAPQIDLPGMLVTGVGDQLEAALTLTDDRYGSWTVDETTLPPGVALDVDALTGQPTATGTFPVAISFTDRTGRTASHTLTLSVVVPAGRITRADLATYLYECADSPSIELPPTSPFSDMPASDPAYAAAVWARSFGLLDATGPEFRPWGPVNNAQLTKELYSFAGRPPYSPPFYSPYLDVDRGHPLYHHITWATSSGYVEGDPFGYFHPDAAVSAEFLAALPYPCGAE